MAERLKAPVLKTGVVERQPWVRRIRRERIRTAAGWPLRSRG